MNIGRREREPIRKLWPKETDFSDWLVTEDGIALIAQDVGIEIENPTREHKLGDFPCDVVANLVGDEDHVVVIENQYGRTNHDHLGKLLTYASVRKAMTGIWIAEEAADDHRQVIDWLNENTPPSVNLYLAELKAYRIGDSDAAPQLDVVCRPNIAEKLTRSGQSPAERELCEWRLAMWEVIHKAVLAHKQPFRLQKPSTAHWSSVALGRSGFSLSMLLTPRNQSIGIEMKVHPEEWKDSAYKQLLADKKAIEDQLGSPLDWREMEGKKSARALLEVKLDPRRKENEKAVCEWFAAKLPLMYATFRDRVSKLEAEAGE